MTTKTINKQFGLKIKRLFELIETVPSWEIYVTKKAELIIKTLYKNQNMNKTLEELDLKYTTARAYLVRAMERIEQRKVNHLRKGQSQQAQRLFKLMEMPNWKESLTEQEILLAERFREIKNFYQIGRELNLAPGNIASTLYGNTQKMGVIFKIENFKNYQNNKNSV